MRRTDRVGRNFSDNMLDYFLTFNNEATWNIVGGAGVASHLEDQSFEGARSLKMVNITPTIDLTITNTTQNTVVAKKTAKCGLMFYLRKEDVSNAYTGSMEIFNGALSIGIETFTLVAEDDGAWYKYESEGEFSFFKGDVVTFKPTFNGDAGFVGNKTLFIDGMHLYDKERNNFAPPIYVLPIEAENTTSIERLTSSGNITNTAYQWNGNTDGSAITLTLPVGIANRSYKIVNTGTSTNSLTLTPNGAELLIGVNSSFTLNDGESLIIAYNAVDGWY